MKTWCKHIQWTTCYYLTGHHRPVWLRTIVSVYHNETNEVVLKTWRVCPICLTKRPKMNNPTPLQKTIERIENELNINGPSGEDVSFENDIKELLSAAKQLEEQRKAKLLLHCGKHPNYVSSACIGCLEAEREALKKESKELKNAVSDWQDISDSLKSALKMCRDMLLRIKKQSDRYPHVFETDIKKILSDPRVNQALENK